MLLTKRIWKVIDKVQSCVRAAQQGANSSSRASDRLTRQEKASVRDNTEYAARQKTQSLVQVMVDAMNLVLFVSMTSVIVEDETPDLGGLDRHPSDQAGADE